MPREINSVAIVGGGFMGAGIAEVSAVAGMPVVVRDLPQFLDAARGRVEKSLAGAVKRGKIDLVKRDEVLARITFTPNPKNGPQLGARQRTPGVTGRSGVCRGVMGQAACVVPGPAGSGSGMRQRVTSKPRAPSLPTWWRTCRLISARRS